MLLLHLLSSTQDCTPSADDLCRANVVFVVGLFALAHLQQDAAFHFAELTYCNEATAAGLQAFHCCYVDHQVRTLRRALVRSLLA